MGGGHEVYIQDSQDQWILLTPGEDGECGGSNSQSGYYLWNEVMADSIVDGETTGAVDDDLLGLGVDALLPQQVRLVIDTGGGAAFGWETQIFLVR